MARHEVTMRGTDESSLSAYYLCTATKTGVSEMATCKPSMSEVGIDDSTRSGDLE